MNNFFIKNKKNFCKDRGKSYLHPVKFLLTLFIVNQFMHVSVIWKTYVAHVVVQACFVGLWEFEYNILNPSKFQSKSG